MTQGNFQGVKRVCYLDFSHCFTGISGHLCSNCILFLHYQAAYNNNKSQNLRNLCPTDHREEGCFLAVAPHATSCTHQGSRKEPACEGARQTLTSHAGYLQPPGQNYFPDHALILNAFCIDIFSEYREAFQRL